MLMTEMLKRWVLMVWRWHETNFIGKYKCCIIFQFISNCLLSRNKSTIIAFSTTHSSDKNLARICQTNYEENIPVFNEITPWEFFILYHLS